MREGRKYQRGRPGKTYHVEWHHEFTASWWQHDYLQLKDYCSKLLSYSYNYSESLATSTSCIEHCILGALSTADQGTASFMLLDRHWLPNIRWTGHCYLSVMLDRMLSLDWSLMLYSLLTGAPQHPLGTTGYSLCFNMWAGSGFSIEPAQPSTFLLLSTCDVSHVISLTRPSAALIFFPHSSHITLGEGSKRPEYEAMVLCKKYFASTSWVGCETSWVVRFRGSYILLRKWLGQCKSLRRLHSEQCEYVVLLSFAAHNFVA